MARLDGILKEIEDFEFDGSILFLISNTPELQKCVADAVKNAGRPYLPWKSRDVSGRPIMSKQYKALASKSRGEHVQVGSQTEDIFQKVRGPVVIPLDPKKRHHMTDMRVWLRIRDCVTFEYFAENKGSSQKLVPTFHAVYLEYRNRLRFQHQEYINALNGVESIFKQLYVGNFDTWKFLKKNAGEYLGKLIEIVTSFAPSDITKGIGKGIGLGSKIENDVAKEKRAIMEIQRQASLTEAFEELRNRTTALRDAIEQTIAQELKDGVLERDYNSLSYRQKLDYVLPLSNLEPLKSANEFKAEIYLDQLNLNYGHLQIEMVVATQGITGLDQNILTKYNPKPLYIRHIKIDKVKVIYSPGAEHVARGLNMLKPYLVKGVDWDLSNLFELPVNKKLIIKFMTWPLGPIKGPHVRMIQKGADKAEGRRIRDNISVTRTPLEPDFREVWESMVGPDSLSLGSKIIFKDYIKPFFDITRFEKFTY